MKQIQRRVYTLTIAAIAAFTTISLSCASKAQRKLERSDQDQSRGFPYGVYHHRVHLTIMGGAPQERDFEGAIRLERARIQMAALSPIGTTLFQVDDDLSAVPSSPQVEIYLEPMKPFKAKILNYYQVLKKMLLLKKSELPPTGQTIELESGSQFTIQELDQNQLPAKMKIEASHFEIGIQVTGYEL